MIRQSRLPITPEKVHPNNTWILQPPETTEEWIAIEGGGFSYMFNTLISYIAKSGEKKRKKEKGKERKKKTVYLGKAFDSTKGYPGEGWPGDKKERERKSTEQENAKNRGDRINRRTAINERQEEEAEKKKEEQGNELVDMEVDDSRNNNMQQDEQ